MRMNHFTKSVAIGTGCIVILLVARAMFLERTKEDFEPFVSHILNPQTQELKLYWKDPEGKRFATIGNLKKFIEGQGKKLIFAMNGGIYDPEFKPLGLLIQDQKRIFPLNVSHGEGNFYLQPNGVFYLTQGRNASILPTSDFIEDQTIDQALQSGPMLVIDGQINPAFQEGSKNVYVRNGVGILPDQQIIFAMSKKEMNFYDFARYFKELGCQDALYLDGFVSRTYVPEKNWKQTDGDFSVIIGAAE